ncbi:LRP chaperone MESD [Hoplias malabaricus]|uniref:LRP chaperone MESD n=1 Tax=Hoplias malabaricus TaxID=27720 RepID=UPI003462E8BE
MAAPVCWRAAVVFLCFLSVFLALTEGTDPKPKKKKDIRDYNDADMARLLEEWEKDDEIEEGDMPEHKRSPPPIDFSKVDPSKPEELLKMSKKGRTLMVFATVSGDPTEKETEEVTSLWQGSLFNANFDVQRFVVGSNRVIFMLRDGSYAWEIKDFLIGQERCEDVTVEGQVFPGKAAKKDGKGKAGNDTKKSKKKDKSAANQANKSKQEL